MKEPGSTPVSPILSIHHVHTATIQNKNSLFIPLEFENTGENKIVETLGLVDSGAGGKFIDQNFAQQEKLELKELVEPLTVYNIDGTLNKKGTIRNYVDLPMTIFRKKTNEQLLVTGLGKIKVILGFTWLNEQNPLINWKTGMVSFPSQKKKINWKQIIQTESPKTSIQEEVEKEEWKNRMINWIDNVDETALLIATITGELEMDIWINAKTNLAMDMAIEVTKEKGIICQGNGSLKIS